MGYGKFSSLGPNLRDTKLASRMRIFTLGVVSVRLNLGDDIKATEKKEPGSWAHVVGQR